MRHTYHGTRAQHVLSDVTLIAASLCKRYTLAGAKLSYVFVNCTPALAPHRIYSVYAAQPPVDQSSVVEPICERLLVLDRREWNETRHSPLADLAPENVCGFGGRLKHIAGCCTGCFILFTLRLSPTAAAQTHCTDSQEARRKLYRQETPTMRVFFFIPRSRGCMSSKSADHPSKAFQPFIHPSFVLLLVLCAGWCEMGSSDDVSPAVLPSPISAEDRIKLKTRGAMEAQVGEGGVGVGEASEPAQQPQQEPQQEWRTKAAQRLGLVRASAQLKTVEEEKGEGGVGGHRVAVKGEKARQIPAEIVYQARRPGGKGAGGDQPGRGNMGARTERGNTGAQADVVAAAAADTAMRCNITITCHACDDAAMRDNAEYCVATGWRQQVRCLNERGVEVEVRFESCEYLSIVFLTSCLLGARRRANKLPRAHPKRTIDPRKENEGCVFPRYSGIWQREQFSGLKI